MACKRLGILSPTATWRSGYAAVCKTVYPGSIPGVASTYTIVPRIFKQAQEIV
jgi:hypothetical protein